MLFDPNKHHRHSIRVPEYDYSSPGIYFVTICVEGRECLFGNIKNGEMILNELGLIVKNEWENIVNRYNNICLDEYAVMPNHLHGIIDIVGAPLAGAHNLNMAINVGAPLAGAQTVARAEMVADAHDHSANRAGARPAPTLGDIIGSFKSLCVYDWLKHIENNNLAARGKFWQRNYYERIIRNEHELNNIRNYIIDNAGNWNNDLENNELIKRLTKEEYDKKLKEFTQGIYK